VCYARFPTHQRFGNLDNFFITTSQRESTKILDGHLYNVSDFDIEEHYTDTHSYTEINLAAIA
jgi:TnpA family transposase